MITEAIYEQSRRKPDPSRSSSARQAPIPVHRCLRGYAFDPTLSTDIDTAKINEVVFKVPWDDTLKAGPVDEYLEVVDYDPSSQCFYEPVDLNDPYILAQDGLPPSEGNPQFHQQMVYAVARTTIQNFERALGRWALWAPHWMRDAQGSVVDELYVPRLRIYPHAMRQTNAYYSPEKKALLFGYFPASPRNPGEHLPGGYVFTCLAHDIIVHETAHALLDGMNRRFAEPTNPDVLAFHEAFADLVALFQHFSFPDVLRHQIAHTRGDLASQNLLGQLAQQFGRASGRYGALRDAIGAVNAQTGQWELATPDPQALLRTVEPHARGAILVAAVFDAFLTIYKNRVADLLRIASNGTGVLAAGDLHPDLVNRLADEAAKSARHVLQVCIRSLDYFPPVDPTFGDFLRAIITADNDIVPDDDRGYRVAFIEAFRRRGIYPHDVRTFSADSLRWPEVEESERMKAKIQKICRDALDAFMREHRYFLSRRQTYEVTLARRHWLRDQIAEAFASAEDDQAQYPLTGLVLSAENPIFDDPRHPLAPHLRRNARTGQPTFDVASLRTVQRITPDGSLVNQVIISLVQTCDVGAPGSGEHFRGGCMLIFDPFSSDGALRADDPFGYDLRYAIRKPILDLERLENQRTFVRFGLASSLRATYFADGVGVEPFALLHSSH